jgi:hypothetical protein
MGRIFTCVDCDRSLKVALLRLYAHESPIRYDGYGRHRGAPWCEKLDQSTKKEDLQTFVERTGRAGRARGDSGWCHCRGWSRYNGVSRDRAPWTGSSDESQSESSSNDTVMGQDSGGGFT